MSTPSFIGVLCKEGIIKFVYSQSANRRTSRIWEARLLFYDERSFYEQPKGTGFAGHRVHQGV